MIFGGASFVWGFLFFFFFLGIMVAENLGCVF